MSFIQIHSKDNVATALRAVAAGHDVTLVTCHVDLQTQDNIPANHKVALRVVDVDEAIIKHGVTIGYATQPIQPGQHVHVHNTIGVQDYQVQQGATSK